jgi:hypothetical protein
MTKKMSTPMNPPGIHAGNACNASADNTATARRPSMSGRYPGCDRADDVARMRATVASTTRVCTYRSAQNVPGYSPPSAKTFWPLM